MISYKELHDKYAQHLLNMVKAIATRDRRVIERILKETQDERFNYLALHAASTRNLDDVYNYIANEFELNVLHHSICPDWPRVKTKEKAKSDMGLARKTICSSVPAEEWQYYPSDEKEAALLYAYTHGVDSHNGDTVLWRIGHILRECLPVACELDGDKLYVRFADNRDFCLTVNSLLNTVVGEVRADVLTLDEAITYGASHGLASQITVCIEVIKQNMILSTFRR